MANVDIRVGKKDAVFFSANPTLILKDGQFLFNSDTLELFIGDGTTQLSALVAINGGGSTLGLIQIIDLDGDFFTDLATATNWIEQFFSDPTIITDKSFNDNIFFFTVPNLTVMDLADGFLNNSTASFIDNFGLITEFQGGSVFYQNNAKHIFKDIFFNVAEAFTDSELDCECNDFNMDNGCAFASATSGTFKIKGDIDPNATNTGFFSASTATILASAKLYTSNAGAIDASLVEAIANGCNVQFEGINLATINNLALKLPIEVSQTTGVALTFVTDSVYGSIASPETGNITFSSTGAKLGVTNIIIHNHSVAPTFAANMKKLSGSGYYVVSVVNYIYVTYINSTEVIYSINQRT